MRVNEQRWAEESHMKSLLSTKMIVDPHEERVLARKWKSDMAFTRLLQDAIVFANYALPTMWTSWGLNVFDRLSRSCSHSLAPPEEKKI